MKLDNNGFKLLSELEGLRLKAYKCASGVWTIGYGNTYYEDGSRVKEGDVITKCHAVELFNSTSKYFENAVNENVTSKINQNQFNALFCFCYNVGISAFKKSTLLKRVNKNPNDLKLIENAFLMWKGKNNVLFSRQKKQIKHYFSIFILLLALSSCDIYKKAEKIKTDTDFWEKIETKEYRKGDTVHYIVPNLKYKDTTIYTYNRQGTTLRTIYNTQGNISQIDCFTSAIEKLKNENRKLLQDVVSKNSEKKEILNTKFFLYLFLSLFAIVFIAIILIFIYIRVKA